MVGARTVAGSEMFEAVTSRIRGCYYVGLICAQCLLGFLTITELPSFASAPAPTKPEQMSPTSAAPKVITWRRVGHASRKAADKGQYELAARGYEKATELAEQSGDQEAALNLQLCLAETLRLGGHLKESGELLAYLEPRIFG